MAINGHKILKTVLASFWSKFGDRRKGGIGYPAREKLQALKELACFVVPYRRQQALEKRREQFDSAKAKLHPWRRFGICFVCGAQGTARHHIVQLQNGGINSKKNLVSLCDNCHMDIHPWLMTLESPDHTK